MSGSFPLFFESLVLVTALSVDMFVACMSYGMRRIRIPVSSALVMNLVCTAVLALSLCIGGVLRPLFPVQSTNMLCFALLFLLGLIKLFDSAIKTLIRRHTGFSKAFTFSVSSLAFVLQVYAEPELADADESRILSAAEAAPLALALSLDGLAVGFGAAMTRIDVPQALVCSFVIGGAAILAGGAAGRRLTEKLHADISWLGGALLILLAFLRLH